MEQLVRAEVRVNSVWAFTFLDTDNFQHVVQVKDNFTCSCYRDQSCPYFCLICTRIFDTDACNLTEQNFKNADSISTVMCSCYENHHWRRRGIDYSFCVKCVGILCNKCAAIESEKCPLCREPNYLSRMFSHKEKKCEQLGMDLDSFKDNLSKPLVDSTKVVEDDHNPMNLDEDNSDHSLGPEDFGSNSDYDDYCTKHYKNVPEEPLVIRPDLDEFMKLWGLDRFIEA